MKSKWLIEKRLETEENPTAIEILRWMLKSPECPLCNHAKRKEIEISVFSGDVTSVFVETKNGWATGIVEEHLSEHIDYDPAEASRVEKLRDETITTLDMAQTVFGRIDGWLEEWERQKDAEGGMSREWLAEATKLANTANQSLKLIGTLKKEIGVDSQLMLAESRVNSVLGIIVDVLRDRPELLNQMELRLSALKAPVREAEFEVL